MAGGRSWSRRRRARPQPQRLERPLRPADGQVDQVGDHGAGRRHLPRALAVIERVAHRVADDVDGVVGAAHLGQRRVPPQQHRRDVQRELVVGAANASASSLMV